MQTRECDIEAPWGKIALKLWGDEKNPVIVAFHGLLDNAGSFDRLIPLLPQHYFYVCVDLPGHGKSSHFPQHVPIHSMNYIMVYKIVLDYFKREKYIIMGHSYGGQLGYIFCQLCPERVEKFIMFDTVKLMPVQSNNYQSYLINRFTEFFKTENKLKTGTAPQYTYEQALDRVQKGHLPEMSKEAAVGILERMLIPKGDGKYELSTDQRLKHVINPLHDIEYAIKIHKHYSVQCPVLIIFGSYNTIQREYLKSYIQFLYKQENIEITFAVGHHDIHNENADSVAPLVIQFLHKKKHKL